VDPLTDLQHRQRPGDYGASLRQAHPTRRRALAHNFNAVVDQQPVLTHRMVP